MDLIDKLDLKKKKNIYSLAIILYKMMAEYGNPEVIIACDFDDISV